MMMIMIMMITTTTMILEKPESSLCSFLKVEVIAFRWKLC
jgi:hypothetical protein